MKKRIGNVQIDGGGLKNSFVKIRVYYNQDISKSIRLDGYEELCDMEYLIKAVKRKMEE